MRREGVKRMITGGLLFFVVAPLVFVLALVLGVGSAINAVAEADRLEPGQSTHLEASQEVSIFVLTNSVEPALGATPSATEPASEPRTSCAVTDPSGAPADLRRTSGAKVSENGDDWREQYKLTAGEAGDYAVTCGDRSTLIMDEDIAQVIGRGVMFVFIALAVPFLFGVVGLGLFVWGLVRFNATKPQPASGYGAPNGGYPQQGGHGYPYSQPGQPPYPPQQGPQPPGPQGPNQPPYDGGPSER